jgi:threonine dehydratase
VTAIDLGLAEIQHAQARIAPHIRRTPAYESAALSAALDRRVSVKLEGLQIGGSFKLRGVANKLLLLGAAAAGGLVTVSGGNHAIAVALAARLFGLDALVLMPSSAASLNVALTEAAGGQIEFCPDAADAFSRAQAYEKAGRTFIHPYDDPDVIAGHGTLALEFLEDRPDLTHVVVSIGGGGLAAGVGAALSGHRPDIQVFGVEPRGAPTMTAALAAGRAVPVRPETRLRTLAAPFATERTLAAARRHLRDVILVTDHDAFRDATLILEAEKVLVEPAASCTLTAARTIAAQLPSSAEIGLILCGSNIEARELLDAGQPGPPLVDDGRGP